MNVEEYIISENDSIINALEVINKNGRGIAYICDNKVLKRVCN